MPPESPWPIVLAVCITLVFVMLLAGHVLIAALFAGHGRRDASAPGTAGAPGARG